MKKYLHRGILISMAFVAILLLLTNIFKQSRHVVMFTGEISEQSMGEAGAGQYELNLGEIDGARKYEIDVSNRYTLNVTTLQLAIFADGTQFEDEQLELAIYNKSGTLVFETTVACSELSETQNLQIQLNDGITLKGDFTIAIQGLSMTGTSYPVIYGSATSDYDTQSNVMYSQTYVNGEFMVGQTYICLDSDVIYAYGSGLLWILLIILAIAAVFSSERFHLFFQSLAGEKKSFWIIFFACAAYLLYSLFAENYQGICDWIGPWYVLDYGLGIGSRLFIGSIMKIFFYNDFLSRVVVYRFVMACLVCLILLLSFCAAKIISASKNDIKEAVTAVFLLYLASPGSVGYLWNESNMGRFELYLMLLAFAALIIDQCVKPVWSKYLLISGITAAMIMIHQGSIFTYFTVIFLICICNTFQNSRISVKNFIGSCCVGAVTIATFVYFHFFSKINFSSLDEISAYVSSKTDLLLNSGALQMEYFSGQYGMFENCFEYENYRLCGLIQLLLLWPLVFIGIYIFASSVRYCAGKRQGMFLTPYPYLMLFNLLYIPLFVFECDWARWFAAIITTKTIEVLYLVWIKDECMLQIAAKLNAFIKNKRLLIALVLIYLASFEKFGSAQFLEQTNRWYNMLFPFSG